MGFGTAVPFNPPSISVEAARRAAAGSGKRKIPAGVMNNLAKKSRKMANEFQEDMEKHVKRKLDSMSGPDDNRKRGLKVAQFIPGKGLEVQGAQQHKDSSIYCSLGEKSHKLVDSLQETFKTMSGKQVSIDFAFKLINQPSLRDKVKNSRITALNCFRHLNPDSFNFQKTGQYITPVNDGQKSANLNWHKTLGPDAAFIRRGTDGLATEGSLAGVWRTADNKTKSVGGFSKHWDSSTESWVVEGNNEAGLANSLISPYRSPYDFEVMYSRINRQVLENYGFALNNFKFQSSSGVDAAGSLQTESINVWSNPSEGLMNFGETANSNEDHLKASFPAQVNNQKIVNQAEDPDQAKFFNEFLEYHSQFGSGKLSYQFSNDGTNPVCIDICVVGVKKGQNVPVGLLDDICAYNYGINKYANQHYLNVNGYQGNVSSGHAFIDWDLSSKEWHTDAKLPFMPNECFKNPQSFIDAVGYVPGSTNAAKIAQDVQHALEQGKKNPFKVVKRDQFIVSSGATRAWNTTFPSIKYRPQVYEDIDYPFLPGTTGGLVEDDKLITTADEYTYILCIGAHGLSTPVEELYPSQTTNPDGTVRTRDKAGTDPVEQEGVEVLKRAIIDHEPTSCSVSVVGTYTETVKPAFPKDVSDRSFCNGRLKLPYFAGTFGQSGDRIAPPATQEDEYPTRLTSVDIATQGQIVRTTDTGITGVGAINTEIGA